MQSDRAGLLPGFALKPLVFCSMLAGLSACSVVPQPIGMDALRAAVPQERSELLRNQEAVTGPVSLDQAMARAVKYNLDFRIKQMESALAHDELDMANFDLLPRLTAAAGYSDRNSENASSSRSVITGNESLEPSVSSDKVSKTADLSLSWNLLDFGVSYYQARQQADRSLVAQEQRRKTIQLIMQQVRQAWWQVAGAQQLQDKVAPVLAQARAALADSRKIEAEQLQPPLETLNYQYQLLDIIRQLDGVNDELAQAKPRLAALMNLEPGRDYQVATASDLPVPAVDLPMDKMEETALLHRPELMEARYNERISQMETRKAIAKLFPGIEFSLGQHYDANSFLVNNSWRDMGLRVSWNLLNVFNAHNITRSAELQNEIAHNQKLALSIAVLTQTQVAYRDFLTRKNQFELSRDLNTVEQKILGHTQNAARNDAQGKLQEIRATASALMSELRLYQSYSALQGAYGQLQATLGMDPLPQQLSADDLQSLSQAIATTEAHWSTQIAPLSGGS